MTRKLVAIEDNGGGLHLFTFLSDGEPDRIYSGFEWGEAGNLSLMFDMYHAGYTVQGFTQMMHAEPSWSEMSSDGTNYKVIATMENGSVHANTSAMGVAGRIAWGAA